VGLRRSTDLHGTARWARLAAQQLREHPLCVMCLEAGQVVPARVADHIEPHKGDPHKFWFGALQSLCSHHHDSVKQQIEKRGYHTSIGVDGWPVDTNHPFNKISNIRR